MSMGRKRIHLDVSAAEERWANNFREKEKHEATSRKLIQGKPLIFVVREEKSSPGQRSTCCNECLANMCGTINE